MTNSKIEELLRDYKLIGEPIFLSNFFNANGKNLIFSTLKKYYKSIYKNNERIIVIHHDYDEYDIEPTAGNSLIFLQNCLQKIDISNCFVVVISSNAQIANELDLIQKKYSTDKNPINHCIVNGPFENRIPTLNSFCIMPWIHLYLHTTGEVFPCCTANKAHPMGDPTFESIDTIVHNEKFNNLRKNMINGVWSSECANCLNSEKNTGTSSRLDHNKKWKHLIEKAKADTDSNGRISQFNIKNIDLRFSNVCNSKCRTCSAEFSSSIQQENKNILPEYSRIKILNEDKRKSIIQQLTTNLDNLESIYFAGGEPLLMTEHYDILKSLIIKEKNKVKIKYNTNLSTKLSYKNINILDLWNQFTDITLGLSIDGYGEIYEYVRHGSKWNQVLTNIEQIKEKCSHVKLAVSSTVSLLSAESIMELQNHWHENNFLSIDNFKIHLVESPPDYQSRLVPGAYDLQMLYPQHKNYLAQKIDKHCKWLLSVNATQLSEDWQKVKQYMFSDDLTFCLERVKFEHNARDNYRNENFDQLYPEFRGLFS